MGEGAAASIISFSALLKEGRSDPFDSNTIAMWCDVMMCNGNVMWKGILERIRQFVCQDYHGRDSYIDLGLKVGNNSIQDEKPQYQQIAKTTISLWINRCATCVWVN